MHEGIIESFLSTLGTYDVLVTETLLSRVQSQPRPEFLFKKELSTAGLLDLPKHLNSTM